MSMSHNIAMQRTLPEELLEKIISMMPYPSIFRARILSKSWYAKFKPISHLKDEYSKRLVKSFHKRVTERSHNWNTFGPVWIDKNYLYSGEEPIVYNQMTRKWQKMLPTALLQPLIDVQGTFTRFDDTVFLEGAFFYGSWMVPDCMEARHGLNVGDLLTGQWERDVYVGNFLTREWKQLPIRPEIDQTAILAIKLVINPTSETYKVVLICKDHQCVSNGDYFAQIFDSKSSTWSSKVFVSSNDFDGSPIGYAYHNGIFYMVAKNNLLCLLAFNMEEAAVQELRLSSTHEAEIKQVKLVICNDNLVMIVFEKYSETVRVLKVDLVSLQLMEVAQCLANSELDVINTHDMISARVIAADCMFFKTSSFDGRILQYNKLKDEWTFFSCLLDHCYWSECTFEPGVNPFMAV